MCKIQEILTDNKPYKPKYEMQDIFRLYGDDYIARHKLNSIQLKAIQKKQKKYRVMNLHFFLF